MEVQADASELNGLSGNAGSRIKDEDEDEVENLRGYLKTRS